MHWNTHATDVFVRDGAVVGEKGEPVLSCGEIANATPTTSLLDWVSDGTVYDFCGKPRLYSGASRVTKFPAPSFTAKATVCVTAKTEGAVDGLLLAAEPVKSPALNWLDQKSDLIF